MSWGLGDGSERTGTSYTEDTDTTQGYKWYTLDKHAREYALALELEVSELED
jgi:hypothetical protein